jgi:hypothetical protein
MARHGLMCLLCAAAASSPGGGGALGLGLSRTLLQSSPGLPSGFGSGFGSGSGSASAQASALPLSLAVFEDSWGQDCRGCALSKNKASPGEVLATVPETLIISNAPGEKPPTASPELRRYWKMHPEPFARLGVKLLWEMEKRSSLVDDFPSLQDMAGATWSWMDSDIACLNYPKIERAIREQRGQWLRAADDFLALTGGRLVPGGREISRSDLFWAFAMCASRSLEGQHEPSLGSTGTSLLRLHGLSLSIGFTLGGDVGQEALIRCFAYGAAVVFGLGCIKFALDALSRQVNDVTAGAPIARHMLVPIVDMCNHGAGAGAKAVVELRTGGPFCESSVVLRATKELQAGEQVLITYGDLSNDELLSRFNFVEKVGSDPTPVLLAVACYSLTHIWSQIQNNEYDVHTLEWPWLLKTLDKTAADVRNSLVAAGLPPTSLDEGVTIRRWGQLHEEPHALLALASLGQKGTGLRAAFQVLESACSAAAQELDLEHPSSAEQLANVSSKEARILIQRFRGEKVRLLREAVNRCRQELSPVQ